MIETCTECSQDFITEADPYGVWRRPNKTHVTCGKCFIQLIEPMRLERIKQLEDALRDIEPNLRAVINYYHQYDNTKWDSCCNGRECVCMGKPSDPEYYVWSYLMSIESVLNRKEILATINKRGER